MVFENPACVKEMTNMRYAILDLQQKPLKSNNGINTLTSPKFAKITRIRFNIIVTACCRPAVGCGDNKEVLCVSTWLKRWHLHPRCEDTFLHWLVYFLLDPWCEDMSLLYICISCTQSQPFFQPPLNFDDVTTDGMVPTIYVKGDVLR